MMFFLKIFSKYCLMSFLSLLARMQIELAAAVYGTTTKGFEFMFSPPHCLVELAKGVKV